LCDGGEIHSTNLIGIKIEMVAQNYPSRVVLLPRYCRFIPSMAKLPGKGNFYPEHKV
jgi:hypothetical protein